MNNIDIKEIRKKLKLTQTEFGNLLNSSLRSVQSWESGSRNMSANTQKLLENIINTQSAQQNILITNRNEFTENSDGSLNLKKRMKEFLKMQKVSQAEFGNKLNKSAGWVNNVGDSLKVEQVNLIKEHYPKLNIDWLLTGEGEMINTKETQKTTSLEKTIKEKVPYYDIDVTSSIVSSFNDVVEQPSFYVDFKPFNDCTAYVNNFGDSMYPKYKNGEKLAVKQIFNLNVLNWGETYLVITNSNANDLKTIKDVHPHEDLSKIILRASNPAFKGDTIIDRVDIISMFAVKGKISQNFI